MNMKEIKQVDVRNGGGVPSCGKEGSMIAAPRDRVRLSKRHSGRVHSLVDPRQEHRRC
jgi:hypothetical protein